MKQRDFLFDIVVVGSGAAGLEFALSTADAAKIAIISKGCLKESSTRYAQGGIAAVMDHADSIESHIEDTLAAGAGLCAPETVRFVVESAPAAVRRLIGYGANFSHRTDKKHIKEYHLTQEGGHSHRRVVHKDDTTGKEVEDTLADQARKHPNISIFENFIAIDLICEKKNTPQGRCIGLYALDQGQGQVDTFRAKAVVLATGGASKVYLYTSNPDICTGDGIAMAWRAGCRVGNMEFSQFHPTCLYHPKAKSQLITEALRGEGAVLLLPNGTRFMHNVHPKAELAPRDIVARAIDHEMKRLGIDCVYLDISYKPASFIKSHFPMLYERCQEFGVDISKEPIPVVPAAHYTCGGVVTDLDGKTDVENLYAIGEVAYTGLHGANRMASNSLLECLVFAGSASRHVRSRLADTPPPPGAPLWDESWVTDSDEEVVVAHNWGELRRLMWNYVGIVRTDKRLERAKRRADMLMAEIDEYYGNFKVIGDLLELRNLTLVAGLIIRSALSRRESRGLHYTLNCPNPDNSGPVRPTILKPDAR